MIGRYNQRTATREGAAMRKLVVITFLTLDGVMQAPGGPEEDPTGNFPHGGWSANYWDEAMGQRMDESMGPGKEFELLLGRKSYEIFAGYWPHAQDQPGAAELNAATKHVASRTLDAVDWENSRLLEGDAAESVPKLKEEDGPEIQVHGSADLIQTLLEHDLVDEFRLMIFPVVLGGGKRLFGDGTVPAAFEVSDSTTATTGVLLVNYKRAGDIPYGSLVAGEPTEAEVERRGKLEQEG
jgi:dihydrofolate reductase